MLAKHPALTILAAATGLALLGSCAASQSAKLPAPPPPPPARPAPQATPAPLPANTNWRDRPASPGVWEWSAADGQSTARFAGGELVLPCNGHEGRVTLMRRLSAQPATDGPIPATVLTTSQIRPLSASAVGTVPLAYAAITFTAWDGLLDAMAFSRGRFAVEIAGEPTLYLPAWTEVSRVVEDCR